MFSAPRVEYIASELIFSAPLNLSKKLLFAQPFVDFIANTVWHLVPPALFTVLAIIFLPRAHEWALRIYLNGYFSRKNIYHEASIKYEKNKTKELEVRATEKTKQAKQRQVIEKSQTQEEKWEEEFLNFKLHPLYQKLTQIIHALYNKGGKTRERMMGEVYICLLMRIFSPSRTQMV
ncbi:MAG: hypothetical protein HYY92_00345 [Parcubacteria group bacterium]|nr:hypothetical protein [Parcubacteria group bacterium]